MKIVFNGLSYFGSKLVDDLNEFAPGHNFRFYDTYTKRIDKLKFAWSLNTADKVVSFNGVSSKSGSMDLVLKKKKKLLMYWHGTDVLKAVEADKQGRIYKEYIDHAQHYTDAPWLKQELKEIGIEANLLPFKYTEVDESPCDKYEGVNILTYVGKGREEFYGLPNIMAAADQLKDIQFNVVGTNGEGWNAPDNLSFLGWNDQTSMKELRRENAIFLRIVEHDGNALSVMEALGAGQEVIWTYPGEHCHLMKGDLANKIAEVRQKVAERNFQPNKENIEWVRENFRKEHILENFVREICG